MYGWRINKITLLFIAFSAALFFSYTKNFNLLAILVRGGSLEFDNPSNNSVQSISLIVNLFIRPMPLICLVIYKLFKKHKRLDFIEIILILITLFSNSPIGMARFQAAALYIPILLVYFKPLSRKLNFTLLFCFGLLVVFPFLNQFRYVDTIENEVFLNTEMFTEEHFDAYQNTVNVVKNETITYGNQILGVVFFYVPDQFGPISQ